MFDQLYHAGLFICGAQGYQNAGGWNFWVILAAAYGGGWLRDTTLLHCEPAFLALETLEEIWFVWVGALFQSLFGNCRKFQAAKFLIDPFATGTFLIIGVSAAKNLGYGPMMAILCGITTALAGGVVSKILSGSLLSDVLDLNTEYRLTIVATSGLYSFWVYNGKPSSEAKLSAILILGTSNIMISPQFQYIIKCLVQQQVLFQPSVSAVLLLCCWLRGIYSPYRVLKASPLPQQPQPWHQTRFHLMQPG